MLPGKSDFTIESVLYISKSVPRDLNCDHSVPDPPKNCEPYSHPISESFGTHLRDRVEAGGRLACLANAENGAGSRF